MGAQVGSQPGRHLDDLHPLSGTQRDGLPHRALDVVDDDDDGGAGDRDEQVRGRDEDEVGRRDLDERRALVVRDEDVRDAGGVLVERPVDREPDGRAALASEVGDGGDDGALHHDAAAHAATASSG